MATHIPCTEVRGGIDLVFSINLEAKHYERAMVVPLENIGIQTAKYCNVAGLGLLIFDYFLTLEPEIRWTWNRRWNVARVLFVISRYMAFVAAGMTSYAVLATRANENDDEHSARTSAGLQMVIDTLNIQRLVTDFTTAIHIISIVAAEGLLILRTYAFWKQSKKLLAVLLVLAAICIACGVGITNFVGGLLDAPVNPSAPPTGNCNFETNRGSAIQYGFLVAYELLRAIFQGGVRYMTAIIFVSVVNIVITSAVPLSYSEMMDLPQVVLHTTKVEKERKGKTVLTLSWCSDELRYLALGQCHVPGDTGSRSPYEVMPAATKAM
ncbi:uncharacterized protein HD556DRAFT_1312339 [Suillus plorans]|uniref:DUF6533 domain-containing protein n=1 Tax=Suillus plorans TaxID=116603 RepID=A0A9P7AGX5_9AGAM|nr:uncharacterized protein HD556DRAFT_1312339 [Suillus plorans]KAG1788068.1 hypothetical protein HD556DRAFT_1312339 [Suillus plorans]